MRILALTLVLLVLAACSTQPAKESLKIGNKVDFALLQDQYANPFPHGQAMELLLFTGSMSASRDARYAMAQVNPACYEQGRLVFVANVSGMPRMVTRYLAVPKMRGYDYPVWLDYNGDATAALPLQDDSVSVIKVSQGEITSIDFVQGLDAILDVLGPLCGLKTQQMAGDSKADE